ncbi:vinorine synthase-like [Melia azedarach]|uniref:Vinorine synthase-like n=1 Tax=Melia azedarach TaxID=155640 RepID=A0ACC1XV52_MELAZ|nr:vinorine synthase-like [Melia azedarach]
MEPEIISTESIKPSSPTPLHLKTHKISLLDQFTHHLYFPIVFYYPFNQDTNLSDPTQINHIVSKRLQLLKQSLPETLSRFYAFAGKIKDTLSIDCNDEGIYFTEARVRSPLSDFFNLPNFTTLNCKFIPFDIKELSGSISGLHVAKIQVTTFACGGLVICACLSHLLGDGITLTSFLKSWVATACENSEGAVHPNNDASSLFPQQENYPKEATWMATNVPFLRKGRFVSRRFLFDAKAIANLKTKATSSLVPNPSRVETVSAFLSKCIMAAFRTKFGSHKPTLLSHVVNLRAKAKPPMSESSMGNIVWIANVLCTNEEEELASLVCRLREAIMEINGDSVKSLQGNEGFLNRVNAVKKVAAMCGASQERITFSSWCNFGLYDIDFGWGKPTWVSPVGLDESVPYFLNNIILTDTRSSDGIEAWVYLLEEDMNILELDEELVTFANLDPNPLR